MTACAHCPWHGLVLALADGRMLAGPATQPCLTFELHVDNGQIEVRRQPSKH